MNKIIKRTLQGIIGAAIISGTYFGRGHDDYPPLYSHKTSDSYGINVAVYTKIDSGASINGANLSLFTGHYGTINGANIGIGTIHRGKNKINGLELVGGSDYSINNTTLINGLQIGIINSLDDGKCNSKVKINGVQIGLIGNTASDVNGIQASVFVNGLSKLNGVQIGIYNETNDNKGIILNVDYHKTK